MGALNQVVIHRGVIGVGLAPGSMAKQRMPHLMRKRVGNSVDNVSCITPLVFAGDSCWVQVHLMAFGVCALIVVIVVGKAVQVHVAVILSPAELLQLKCARRKRNANSGMDRLENGIDLREDGLCHAFWGCGK